MGWSRANASHRCTQEAIGYKIAHSRRWSMICSSRIFLSKEARSLRWMVSTRAKGLDLTIFSVKWVEYSFLGSSLQILPQPTSNHFLVLVAGGKAIPPTPFRFENRWLKDERFLAMVKDRWSSFDFKGFDNYIILKKAKALKSGMKV